MSRLEFMALIMRLIAVFIAIFLLLKAPHIYLESLSVSQGLSMNEGGYPQELLVSSSIFFITMAFLAVVMLVLWFFPLTFANKVLPKAIEGDHIP